MLLYNITLIVEADRESEVIGKVRGSLNNMASPPAGKIARLLRMQDSPHEGSTYSLQVQAEDQGAIAAFRESHLHQLQSELELEFPGKVFYFESVMEYII